MMDDQRQIQAGAGLQESRLNEDFINFLRKWGPFFTYGVLAIVLVWLGIGQYQSWQARQTDQAFADLAAADAIGTVAEYTSVAEKWEGRAAVSTLARLQAARVLQSSALLGLEQGASAFSYADEDVLTEEERAQTWRASIELLRQIERSESARGRTLFAQRARWMMVDAQISLGEFDAAQETLEAFERAAIAEHGEDAPSAMVARERLARLDALRAPVTLAAVARTPVTPATPAAPSGDGLLDFPVDIRETPITRDILNEATRRTLERQQGGDGDAGGTDRSLDPGNSPAPSDPPAEPPAGGDEPGGDGSN